MENWLMILSIFVLIIGTIVAYMGYLLSKIVSAEALQPKLQIMPTKFQPHFPNKTQCGIFIQITNYTNFPAFNVKADTQYPGNSWIMDWCKTRIKELESKGNSITIDEEKELTMRKKALKPVQELAKNDSLKLIQTGDCSEDICELARVNKNYLIRFKINWENKKGRKFEKIVKYQLICTKVGEAEDYSFVTPYKT